jgi:hypothetical protein
MVPIEPPMAVRLKRMLASIGALRRTWYLAIALRDVLRWRPVTQSRYTEIFTQRRDPFGYEGKGFEFEKFQAAIGLLDDARNDACFELGNLCKSQLQL